MLRDMRKCDRDRDRVLHPIQIENMMEKYKIGVAGVLPQLQERFVDKKFNDMTNYEDMVKYFCDMKEKETKISNPNNVLDATSTKTNNKSFKSRNSNDKTIPQKISQKQTSNNANNIFEDREDAKLILQLESAIGQSPKFDLEKFKSSLESKVY